MQVDAITLLKKMYGWHAPTQNISSQKTKDLHAIHVVLAKLHSCYSCLAYEKRTVDVRKSIQTIDRLESVEIKITIRRRLLRASPSFVQACQRHDSLADRRPDRPLLWLFCLVLTRTSNPSEITPTRISILIP